MRTIKMATFWRKVGALFGHTDGMTIVSEDKQRGRSEGAVFSIFISGIDWK